MNYPETREITATGWALVLGAADARLLPACRYEAAAPIVPRAIASWPADCTYAWAKEEEGFTMLALRTRYWQSLDM